MPLILNGTNGEIFPSWTTGSRPASPSAGQMGYNTTTGQFDFYTASGWVTPATLSNLALVPISIVTPAGTSSFGFSVTAYRQYIVFYQNVSGSTNSTVMSMKCSTNGGSTFSSNINTTNVGWYVNGTSAQAGSTTGVGTGFVWSDTWNSATNGTNGIIGIGGTPYGSVNRRLSWWAVGAGQTAGNQGVQLSMGQTQDDSNQYNYVAINMNAGTFNNTATFIICGVKES